MDPAPTSTPPTATKFSPPYRPAPFPDELFLAALQNEQTRSSDPMPELRDWSERAAVLAWFEPAMIGAPPEPEALLESEVWLALIADCEVVRTAEDGSRWRLKSPKRRAVLTTLGGSAGLQRVLAETVGRAIHDPIQRALDQIIAGESIEPAKLSQLELYAMHIVAEWLNGLVPNVPDPQILATCLRRQELLEPHRILAAGFIGRLRELDDLRGYVEELPSSNILAALVGNAKRIARWFLSRPPLVIHGPGGIGKSSLVAKFIVEHADADGLVFVDLDFGRPNLDPRRPAALLAEAARQIASQVPSLLAQGDVVAAELENAAAQSASGMESVVLVSLDDAVKRFAMFAQLALPPQRKVPFVLDTFEEVQALGDQRVEGVWTLLKQLQEQVPQLRPVVCSRVPPPDSYGLLNLELHDLEPVAAEAYLSTRLRDRHNTTLPSETISGIVARVVRTPLGLNLAADVVTQAIEAGEPPVQAVARVIGRADEAFLYQRVLKQIRDPQLRRLATPGLAVRRLDPDVLLAVLAKPCGLNLDNRAAAETLLKKMAEQVALVERQPDGSLQHRADVRSLMLPAIEKSEGLAKIRQIDQAASEYYKALSGIVAATERVYHLLRLGNLDVAEQELTGEIANQLRGVQEELESDARMVLALRLGVTPSDEQLRAADVSRWQRGVLAVADDLLRRGAYQQVLKLVADRPDRPRGTAIDRVEAEAALGAGDVKYALEVAQSGLQICERNGYRELGIELALVLVRASLIVGDATTADKAAHRAEAMVMAGDTPDIRMRALTAAISVAQLLNESDRIGRLAAELTAMLDPGTLDRLSPAVLRTLAGQLQTIGSKAGESGGRILRAALRRLGIEQKTSETLDGLALILSNWISDTRGTEATDIQRLLSSLGTMAPPSNAASVEAWRDWLKNVPGPQLGNALAALLKSPRSLQSETYAKKLQSTLTGYMSETARAAIERGVRSAAS